MITYKKIGGKAKYCIQAAAAEDYYIDDPLVTPPLLEGSTTKGSLPEYIKRESKKLLRMAKDVGFFEVNDRVAAESILREIAIPRDKPVLPDVVGKLLEFAEQNNGRIYLQRLSQAQQLVSRLYGFANTNEAARLKE